MLGLIPVARGAKIAKPFACLLAEVVLNQPSPGRDAELFGMLREAGTAYPSGSFGVSGDVTAQEADRMGSAWVGAGARSIEGGKGLVSADGTKIYRSPTTKGGGTSQANFIKTWPLGAMPRGSEARPSVVTASNAHVNIKSPNKAPGC